MTEPIRASFMQWDCEVQRLEYPGGRTALVLIDARDGDQVATVTVNLPDQPLGANEVFVKDWSENDGMVAAMERAGILRNTGEYVRAGYVVAPKCELIHPQLVRAHPDALRGHSRGAAERSEEDRGHER